MAKGGHKQASEDFGANPILGFRWVKVLETLLNAVLDTIRVVVHGILNGHEYVRTVQPLHAELPNYEAARIAKEEWLWALAYFHEVSEPGLVDYAVYSLHAAERKYMYLLDKARKEYASTT